MDYSDCKFCDGQGKVNEDGDPVYLEREPGPPSITLKYGDGSEGSWTLQGAIWHNGALRVGPARFMNEVLETFVESAYFYTQPN